MSQQDQSLQQMGRAAVLEEEVLQSSRHSRHALKLCQPVSHTSNIPHTQIISDPLFRSCFGVRQRLYGWCLSCVRCVNNSNSFVQVVDEAEKRFPAVVSEDMKRILQNKIMKLKISQTSRLRLDANVMHPFVKQIFHYTQFIQSTKIQDAMFKMPKKPKLTNYNKIQRKYQSTQNDIILPFATTCCDFRKLGNSKGVWNQKFYINYPAYLLLNPDVLFLFQILDFNHQALVYRNSDGQFNKNNLYRVAWSFLRPVGLGKTHIGQVCLQLYKYKYQQGEYGSKSFIPEVYYDYIWNNHERYEGYLQVQLSYCKKPKYLLVKEDNPVPSHLFEEQYEDKKYLQKYYTQQNIKNDEDPTMKVSKQLFKFYRNRDICQVPKQLIYKLQSQELGCYRVKFIGNYLLAASSKKKTTSLKVYNLNDGQHVMNLRGHRGVIYSIQITPNQKIVVTSGSDHIVRVCFFPQNASEFIDEDQSQQFIIGDCVHTAAVYSSSLLHLPLENILYILTCCYDGFVRLWKCDITNYTCKIVQQISIADHKRKVYPVSSTLVDNSFFLVGDSVGQLRVFDFVSGKINQRCTIAHEQLKNDGIIFIRSLSKNHIILQATDNLIRHFELQGNKLRLNQTFTGGVYQSQLANCAISPDNKYLLAASETGRPILWDIFTGNQVDLDHLNLNLKGKLVCCDWHSKYNLISVSGFISFCPVFVYGNVLSQSQIKMVSAHMQ